MSAGQFLRLGYRLLLRPFPRRYRAEYQPELESVIGQLAADEARRGWWALARMIGRELRDLPAALLREHWREWRQRAVNANPLAASLEEPLAGWRWLAVFAPFVLTSLLVLPWHIPFGIVGLAVIRALVLIGTLAILLRTLIDALILQAIRAYVDKNVDFIDPYNAAWMSSQGLRVAYTFEHKHFARLESVVVRIPERGHQA